MAKDNKNIMTTSDFNLEKLNTKELSDHVAATIQVGGNISIFGRRGVGKTEISKQQIKRSGCHELYINLSVMERTDLGGYPSVFSAKNERYVSFLMPKFYEILMEGNEDVVALLDEVDKAEPSLWAPLLEFTQFKSINGTPLKNLKAVIMTGNLISEGGSRPSLPLLDRSEKYLVEADAQSWLEWAGKSGGIHPSITAYISDHPRDLFGNVDPEDRYADPSPRGWHGASDLLYKGEDKGWSYTMLNKKVCGRVGKDAGIKYSNYYEHYQQLLPMIEDIFKGKDVSKSYNAMESSKKLVACMITCARLATTLDNVKDEELPPAVDFVGKFLKKVDHEMVLVSVRSQIQVDRLISHDLNERPEWGELFTKVTKSAGGVDF